MADGPVTIRGAIDFSWTLWTTHWRAIWGVLALSSLAGTVAIAGQLSNNDLVYAAGLGASVTISLMANGAVFRLAFADRHPGDAGYTPGPSGLQWRAMEWRMLGASLLLFAFELIVIILLVTMVVAVAAAIMVNRGAALAPPTTPEAVIKALGPEGGSAVSILAIAAYAVFLFVMVRLSLTAAATADEGRIQVLSTWRRTKGQFWRIVASLVVVTLPLILASFLIGATSAGPAPGSTAAPALSPSAALLSGLILGILSGGVVQPLMNGVLAYYCRKLRTPTVGGAT